MALLGGYVQFRFAVPLSVFAGSHSPFHGFSFAVSDMCSLKLLAPSVRLWQTAQQAGVMIPGISHPMCNEERPNNPLVSTQGPAGMAACP